MKPAPEQVQGWVDVLSKMRADVRAAYGEDASGDDLEMLLYLAQKEAIGRAAIVAMADRRGL